MAAMTRVTIGYVMAPLILPFSFAAFSRYWESRLKIVSRIPPTSPAAIIFTKRVSNWSGYFFKASARVSPLSTDSLIFFNIFLNVLFSCCDWSISRHWIIGRPASIIVENCLQKRIISVCTTFGCIKDTFSKRSLGFSFTLTGVSFSLLSCAFTASSLTASISPFLISFFLFLPFHRYTGMIFPVLFL